MSKKSYFNKTVFRKNLTRFFPLWFLYTVVILLMGPAQAMQRTTSYEAGQTLLNIYGMYSYLNLGYGFVAAILLFSYLFSARSANMYHSFPVRREAYFFTNVLSGLLFNWAPNALAALLCIFFSQAELSIVGLWFLVRGLEYLLGFSVAVLAMQCAGNFIGAGLLTLVLHAGLPVGEYLARYILTPLLYGLLHQGVWTGEISPAYWLVKNMILRYGQSYYYDVYDVSDTFWTAITVSWGRLAVLGAYGVVCLALALVLYRKRPMEAAGDIVAFPKLRPVFKYVFALGCALVFGGTMLDVIFPGFLSSNWIQNPWKILVCLSAAGAVGYFAGEMLLEKTVRVFRPKYLLRCAGVVVFLCACVLAVHFDPAKIQEKVPDWTEVEAVQLSTGWRWSEEEAPKITDEEAIREVVALHGIFLDNRQEIQDRIDGASGAELNVAIAYINGEPIPYHMTDNSVVTIRYSLKDGSTLARKYCLFTSVDLPDIENLGQRLNTVLNRQDYMEARFFAYSRLSDMDDPWEYLRENVESARVLLMEWDGTVTDSVNLWEEAQLPALADALRADIEAKALSQVVTDAFLPSKEPDKFTVAQIELRIYGWSEVNISYSYSLDTEIDTGCANTLAYLQSQGMEFSVE